QVKMQQQLSNRDASLLKSCSTKNGTTATSKITTCKNGATTLGPTVISASIAAAVGSYLFKGNYAFCDVVSHIASLIQTTMPNKP
ncbi:hypothetical protein Tco_0963880, partial [Tanacetum coccineum]